MRTSAPTNAAAATRSSGARQSVNVVHRSTRASSSSVGAPAGDVAWNASISGTKYVALQSRSVTYAPIPTNSQARVEREFHASASAATAAVVMIAWTGIQN